MCCWCVKTTGGPGAAGWPVAGVPAAGSRGAAPGAVPAAATRMVPVPAPWPPPFDLEAVPLPVRRRPDVAQDDAIVGRAPRVAAALAAGRVGDVARHRDRRLHLAGDVHVDLAHGRRLGLHELDGARLDVAFDARDLPVHGGLPRRSVRAHLMARADAEAGALRVGGRDHGGGGEDDKKQRSARRAAFRTSGARASASTSPVKVSSTVARRSEASIRARQDEYPAGRVRVTRRRSAASAVRSRRLTSCRTPTHCLAISSPFLGGPFAISPRDARRDASRVDSGRGSGTMAEGRPGWPAVTCGGA